MVIPTQGLRVIQTQRLILTPSLRQSIGILRMSATELADHVAAELADNPLLIDENVPSSSDGAYQFALETVAHEQSLSGFLADQIATSSAPNMVRNIAAYLAADLTDAGFLTDDEPTIAAQLGVDTDLVKAAIAVLQGCEPAGIGARNLTECLDLQLRALGQPDRSRQIILANLAQFATRDWDVLAELSGLSHPALFELAGVLRSLTPRPAQSIAPPPTQTLRPDIQVLNQSDDRFTVEMVASVAPALRINESLAQSVRLSGDDARDYLREKTDRANALIRAIEARSKTVLRVAQAIVGHQFGFFLHGPDHLKPLTMKAVADSLDLHPSTVTRAIANKSLSCRQGVFALRFFFQRSLEHLSGDDNISVYAVQLEIRRLVERESADHILSDDNIMTILRESGVDIARRTVAKYRQCLNISSSVQRRKSKRFL